MYKTLKDSVLLELNFKGNAFTGNLEYHYLKKDQNIGTLMGSKTGDTLIAEYRFMSEGMESSREVAFLKSGTDLVEGYGDVEEKNNKVVFKNH